MAGVECPRSGRRLFNLGPLKGLNFPSARKRYGKLVEIHKQDPSYLGLSLSARQLLWDARGEALRAVLNEAQDKQLLSSLNKFEELLKVIGRRTKMTHQFYSVLRNIKEAGEFFNITDDVEVAGQTVKNIADKVCQISEDPKLAKGRSANSYGPLVREIFHNFFVAEIYGSRLGKDEAALEQLLPAIEPLERKMPRGG